MRLPSPRGPLSRWCVEALRGETADPLAAPLTIAASLPHRDVLSGDDAQLALWMLFELHYDGFDDVDPRLEWDPGLLTVRRVLEDGVEAELRSRTDAVVDAARRPPEHVADTIFALVEQDDGPSLAGFVHQQATVEQLLEMLVHRSVLQLKEADPHTFVIPRLRGGRAKTALCDIQYDEYGSGRPDDLHARLFARTLEACGLDPVYGGYVDRVPGSTLALSNVASMFGLQRRLRAAALGHLCAIEASSALPSRRIVAGLRRLGFGPDAARYFDEHVEADSVHEQVAARQMCAPLVAEQPQLLRDVLFGVAACLATEAQFAEPVLRAWSAGRSSLYTAAGSPAHADAC